MLSLRLRALARWRGSHTGVDTCSPPPPRFARLSVLIALCAGSAVHAEDPLATLKGMYDGVRTHSMGGRLVYIYGAPMTPGLSEAQAAADFLAQHRDVFGPNLEFMEQWNTRTRDGRFTVFAYSQQIREKQVAGSLVRVKVRRGNVPRVDYAAALVAGEPLLGTEVPVVSAEVATMLVEAQPGYGQLVVSGDPVVVVLRGNADRADAWAWAVEAVNVASDMQESYTFFLDTGLGRILKVNNNFWDAGPVTTGMMTADSVPLGPPWHPYIPEQTVVEETPIGLLRIVGDIGGLIGKALTDVAGEFGLELGNINDLITLSADVSAEADEDGQWYSIIDQAGDPLKAETNTLVGSSVHMHLSGENTEPAEYLVSQADIIVTANRARDFHLTYMGVTNQWFERRVAIETNRTFGGGGSCRASISPPQLTGEPEPWTVLFGRSDATAPRPCYNFGNHSIAAHEFGHWSLHIVTHPYGAISMQPHFHEGYADSFGTMLNDYNIQGPHLFFDGSNAHDDPTESHINCQYPTPDEPEGACFCGSPHGAGQLLSGVWVRIREGYKIEYGQEEGLELAREAFGAWTLITAGQESATCNTAHPGTAIEVLDVVRPGPAWDIVCDAFQKHNIECP
jgi:hypothetical protein